MFGGIDIYQDAKGHFPMGAARFIHRPRDGGPRCREFVGTIYCDRGHIRQPFDETLVDRTI